MGRMLLAFAVAVVAGGCTLLAPTAPCETDDECVSRCVAGACVDAPPAATPFHDADKEVAPPDAGAPPDEEDVPDEVGAADGGAPPQPPIVDGPFDAGVAGCGVPDAFVWRPLADTTCLREGTSGYALRAVPGATRVVVRFLEAPACLDAASCAAFVDGRWDGYGAAELGGDLAAAGGGGVLDRCDDDNPFRHDHVVLVPDCTGDLHLGSRAHGDGRWHVGALNADAVLADVATQLPGVDHVVVAGSRGGALGALAHTSTAAQRFPGAQIDLVDDQFPPVASGYYQQAFMAAVDDAYDLAAVAPDAEYAREWGFWLRAAQDRVPGLRTTLVAGRVPTVACALQDLAPWECEAAVADFFDAFADVPQIGSFPVDDGDVAFLSRDLGSLVVDARTLGALLAERTAPIVP